MTATPTILRNIITRKREEITERKARAPLVDVMRRADSAEPVRGFSQALLNSIERQRPAVIAEIKKASPSKGIIRVDFDPEAIARSYQDGGATCLSVLTDVDFFQGADEYLQRARSATQLPVIRKDFIVDSYQVAESRALGADCILLIVAALESRQLNDLYQQAQDLGMDVLIEVHNRAELEQALVLGDSLIGINNRDLHSFDVSLATTFDLLEAIPSGCHVITESGILTQEHVQSMMDRGIYGFLIGESFMRADDPGTKLAELFFKRD